MTNPLAGNPNALVGGPISTLGGGELVINIAKAFGQNISAGWALTIAGAVTYAVLFVGREGLAGVWNLVKHGTQSNGKETP